MKLQRSRESELIEIAEDIAGQYSPTGMVDVAHICREKDIQIIHEHYGEGKFDGMLRLRDSEWFILCNRDSGNTPGSVRERFTVSHELGHFFIPEHRRQLMAGCEPHGSQAGAFDGADSPEELEADTFAANLLMPPSRFVPALRSLRFTPMQSVVRLRGDFRTSTESTAIQTMRHDERIVAIARWSDESLSWHRIADKFFRDDGLRSFSFRQRSSLPPDCATAAALADPASQSETTIHETTTTAAFCFGHVAGGGQRDILFREEAIRVGRFGVLAIYSTR